MYLLSADGTYIYSDDDGAEGRNSRIENDLPAGTYPVEATTYGDREHEHELTEFTLTIEIVDEDGYKIKAEDIYVPEPIVVGQPITVHCRVGNAGRTDLPETHSATVSLYGPGVNRTSESILASDCNWKAGVSHHSGEPTAISASVTHRDVKPFMVTFNRPGDNWAFVAVVTNDGEDEEEDFHGFFVEFLALNRFVFDQTTVNVDGLGYQVSAVADEEGEVTTTVTSGITPDAEVPRSTEAKALYTAGVLTQRLDPHLRTPGCSRSADHGRRGGDQRGESFVERLDEDLWTTVLKSCPGFRDEDISAGRSVGKSGGGRGTSSGDGGNCVGPGSLHRSDVEGAAKPNRGRVAHLL